jgi:CRISPR/Cas system type I-B associated protein Csh2 (Cas7 group RAMP superfamily)
MTTKITSGSCTLRVGFQRHTTLNQGGFFMLTQKLLEELLFHHSSNHEECSMAVVLHLLKDLSEKLDRVEALLERRQQVDTKQFKDVQRSMLNKVEKQLRHLEETHTSTLTDLSTELKSVKQSLESARSKFIGFH